MKRVLQAKIITSVRVAGEKSRRPVYYVRGNLPYTANGVPCLTPHHKCHAICNLLTQKDVLVEEVLLHLWDCLNFVHDGKVPRDWNKNIQAIPFQDEEVADWTNTLVNDIQSRRVEAVDTTVWSIISRLFKQKIPKNWDRELRARPATPLLLLS